jgi:hypothetical protein
MGCDRIVSSYISAAIANIDTVRRSIASASTGVSITSPILAIVPTPDRIVTLDKAIVPADRTIVPTHKAIVPAYKAIVFEAIAVASSSCSILD